MFLILTYVFHYILSSLSFPYICILLWSNFVNPSSFLEHCWDLHCSVALYLNLPYIQMFFPQN
jgi:hypothetical protein